MTTPLDEDDFTELVSADFPRVDLVGHPANGSRGWLVMKQDAAAGLLDAKTVRGLIAKGEPEEAPMTETTLSNGIVLKGSPAAMAAFIHAASARREQREADAALIAAGRISAADVAKADMSTASINDLPDDAFGYVEPGGKKDESGKTTPRSLRHFPLNDAAHVRNALSRAPQSPFGDKAMPKIRSAAKKFDIDVAKEEAAVDTVAKDLMDAAGEAVDLDEDMDSLDPTVPLACPDDPGVPGDPTDPGSPAWEAIDAATAAKWLSIAARLRNVLGILAERELLEAASADPDDAENAWDLQDAQCAVDYAIEQLAVFAATEQAEADLGAECMEAIGKSLGSFDPAPLGVIEGLAAVRKAGRVLSASNEKAIRDAVTSLQGVLASLPEAPVAKQKEGVMPDTQAADVAKEATPEEQARDSGPVNAGGTTGMGQPRATGPSAALPGDGPQAARAGDMPGRAVVKGLQVIVYDRAGRQCITSPDAICQPVAKADGDGDGKPKMQAVFDQDGDLIGVVDPDAITPVAGAASGGSGDGDGMQPGPAAAAAPDADDMEPQPAADAGTPADEVGKAATAPEGTTMQDVIKSITDAQAEFTARQAAALEAIAKAATAGREEMAAEVETLKARLKTVEDQDAASRVFANGARPADGELPPRSQLRGHADSAGLQIDVAKAAERKRELYSAPDARAQAEIAKSMNGDAIAALTAIHGRRPAQAPAGA